MENLIFYRKYRPKNFSDVLGQEHITEILKNSIKKDRVSHAYLFFGPRGTGKTTVARIFAKAINCQYQKEGEPCNKCHFCTQISNQSTVDVVEIDAASNTGVDNIREIVEGIKFNPVNLKYKVFIIDEVHMLSKGAFNALLKTLEEPPLHAVFILATTEVHKLPETILSRVMQFYFKKVPLELIVKKIKSISKNEGIKISEDAAKIIAQFAEGGLRDAESILFRVACVLPDQITKKQVEDILGIVGFDKIAEFMNLYIKKDKAKIFEFISNLNNDGIDIVEFLKSLLKYLQNIMCVKLSERLKEQIKRELTKEQFEYIIEQSKEISEGEIALFVENLIWAQDATKKTSTAILPFEVAVFKSLAS